MNVREVLTLYKYVYIRHPHIPYVCGILLNVISRVKYTLYCTISIADRKISRGVAEDAVIQCCCIAYYEFAHLNI